MVWLPVSLAALLAVAAAPRDLRWLRRYRYTWLFAGLLLLAATLVFGVNPSGAQVERLWLQVGPLYLQPSEILKLLFIAYLSSYLAEKRELIAVAGLRLGRFRVVINAFPALPYLAPLLAMWGLAMILLASQQDMGAALLFFFTFLAMLYIASGQPGYVVIGLGLFLVGATIAYRLIGRVALRVDIWWNPWADASGRAFQIVQSLIAFGAGGLVGQGLGQGAPTVIPVVHSDFVYAAIGEEFGLSGTLAVVALYGVLMMRGFRSAMRARAPFAQLLGAGLSTLIGLQAWVIMAGNAGLIPLTGVTLSFLSYGGSSLLASLVAIGLLLQVSNRAVDGER
jgi:cell division protein FtsW (lipid II flippase)